MSRRIVFALALAASLISLLSTTARTAGGAESVAPPATLSFATGKVCSGAVGGTFRDTVNVPDGYKISDCEELAKKLALTVARHSKPFTYNVGCLTPNGYTWSDTPGRPPESNPCKW